MDTFFLSLCSHSTLLLCHPLFRKEFPTKIFGREKEKSIEKQKEISSEKARKKEGEREKLEVEPLRRKEFSHLLLVSGMFVPVNASS